MEERLRFVHDALSDRFDMSELCARYGVSRRVGYKWLARYEADGRRGLGRSQSRAEALPASHGGPHHRVARRASTAPSAVGRAQAAPRAARAAPGDSRVARAEHRR